MNPNKPRILLIERDHSRQQEPNDGPASLFPILEDRFEVQTVRSIGKALAKLRTGHYAGLVVDTEHLNSLSWVGGLLQADEVLQAIADGVAVVDPETRVVWANAEFRGLVEVTDELHGTKFERALGSPENLTSCPDPFAVSLATRQPTTCDYRVGANKYLRVSITPVYGGNGDPSHLIALTRDITEDVLRKQKLDAIHSAGEELADITPEQLTELNFEDRTDLLKYNIVRHMRDLLGLDYIEIRLLDTTSQRLSPLLTEGMTPLAATRELYARKEGNGVTGFVAATGKSYICRDTTNDPFYLEGARDARSSLTVPLMFHGKVIGTLNVESATPAAFDERDQVLAEIYARSVASALTTLDLLQVQRETTVSAYVELITKELAIPLDELLNDATTVLDRYAGHDEEIVSRMRHLIFRTREIRGLIQSVTSKFSMAEGNEAPTAHRRFDKLRVLVADSEEAIRQAAHQILGHEGADVETAATAQEAIALVRQSQYGLVMVDIRLPDLNGYEVFQKLRQIDPNLKIVFITGFGYDPTHSIVNARKEGLKIVVFKPFTDPSRFRQSVDQALSDP